MESGLLRNGGEELIEGLRGDDRCVREEFELLDGVSIAWSVMAVASQL